MNYLIRLQKTKIEMKKGTNFETAIKTLKPPVFWKEKESFQKHCTKWPLESIEKSIYRLVDTEVACKVNSRLANLNCSKSILLLSNNGKKYFAD